MHPAKWRETIDPFELEYHHFRLTEILGYPHAGNDVFHAKGIYQQQETEVYIKVARQQGADIRREIDTVLKLNLELAPEIIDYDQNKEQFVVTIARQGERLSMLLNQNKDEKSMDYLFEYGQTLAILHQTQGNFENVKDRRFFHIPPEEHFRELRLEEVYHYLVKHKPERENRCFCHGDFHYANILWKEKHISAILDFELSGMGNREFDIAWALIVRPGQRFLLTEEEIREFLRGYASEGTFQGDLVRYYMVLIYSFFYKMGETEYQDFVRSFLQQNIR